MNIPTEPTVNAPMMAFFRLKTLRRNREKEAFSRSERDENFRSVLPAAPSSSRSFP